MNSKEELKASVQALNKSNEKNVGEDLAKLNQQLKEMSLDEFKELYNCIRFQNGFTKIRQLYGENCLPELSLKAQQLENISTELEKHLGSEFRDVVIATGFKLLEVCKIGMEFLAMVIMKLLDILIAHKNQVLNFVSQAGLAILPRIVARFSGESANASGLEISANVALDIFKILISTINQ
ncbi:uncharacterized protein LOC110860245 isoform X2 [Folsomia candida]|nr:uncharacterized protein LOC110860245 isoform X2 [Folsomia candida]